MVHDGSEIVSHVTLFHSDNSVKIVSIFNIYTHESRVDGVYKSVVSNNKSYLLDHVDYDIILVVQPLPRPRASPCCIVCRHADLVTVQSQNPVIYNDSHVGTRP